MWLSCVLFILTVTPKTREPSQSAVYALTVADRKEGMGGKGMGKKHENKVTGAESVGLEEAFALHSVISADEFIAQLTRYPICYSKYVLGKCTHEDDLI